MKRKIVIVDYSMGNLRSVYKKIKSLGYLPVVSNQESEIKCADKIILPGVGHFHKGIQNLKRNGLYDIISEQVLVKQKPIFGICLGMQLMTQYSEEGECEGLGWIKGKTIKFKFDCKNIKVPHMGWNTLQIKRNHIILRGLSKSDMFYFVHSYYVSLDNDDITLTKTKYGIEFTSSFTLNNIIGVQFHPEKSHDLGELLIKNFCEM